MSHNLARLRALFGDELLTRGSEGMRPTPRALALVDPVRVALAQIEALVSRDQAFDPRTAERLFRIGLPDSMEVLLGPALLAHLCEAAPGVRLRLHTIDRLVCWTNSTPTASTSPSASELSPHGAGAPQAAPALHRHLPVHVQRRAGRRFPAHLA